MIGCFSQYFIMRRAVRCIVTRNGILKQLFVDICSKFGHLFFGIFGFVFGWRTMVHNHGDFFFFALARLCNDDILFILVYKGAAVDSADWANYVRSKLFQIITALLISCILGRTVVVAAETHHGYDSINKLCLKKIHNPRAYSGYWTVRRGECYFSILLYCSYEKKTKINSIFILCKFMAILCLFVFSSTLSFLRLM